MSITFLVNQANATSLEILYWGTTQKLKTTRLKLPFLS